MNPVAPLLLLGLLFANASKASASAAPPKPKPLPKPLGKPPAKVTPIYVVPGSPPNGGAVPGSPPKGGALPGSKPKAAAPGPYVEKPTPNSSAAKYVDGNRVAPFVSMPAEKPYVAPKKTTTAKKPATAKPAAKKPAPAGTVKAAPVLEPNRGSTPPGYDPGKARARARALAAYLAKKGPASYDHAELASWQKQAALTPDGKYGGSTRGALIHYGVPNPPRPFFAPVATLPYIPPEKR